MQEVQAQDQARERLLDEAEILFGKHGFDGVSVRVITHAAGVNVASVNYYFGGKKNLYLQVIRERWVPRAQRIIAEADAFCQAEAATPEQMIQAVANAFINGFDNEAERESHLSLIQRELASPSEALAIIAQEAMAPMFQRLSQSFARLVPDMPQERLLFYVYSVFAQIIHFCFGRVMFSAMVGRPFDDQLAAEVVEHICQFSLAGLVAKE